MTTAGQGSANRTGAKHVAPPGFDTPESFEVMASSAPEALAEIVSVVCVPTFRRPDMLEATLRSLSRQRGGHDFAVIVVENEGIERAGALRASALLAAGLFKGLVIVEPRQGNCKAYNAAWRCALTRFPRLEQILGIDDDEEAEPGWLDAFVTAARTAPAELFGGSVTPVFADHARAWLSAHPVFRSHYDASGPVPMLYSSANYLIRREVLARLGFPFLDESFDFTGGGDTDFFSRAKAAGFRFWWVQEAAQRETMPARRSESGWIAARGLRNGAISAAIERRRNPGLAGRVRVLAKSLALLAAAGPRGLVLGLRTGSGLIGLYHAQVAIGRLLSEFGVANEQYRKPEKN
ncbi:glycosyltransferase [Bosea sp. (in: a-proteobacteria)]|uniref:glycosyltransferase family 2 protein n=1 Tax=Bosea sp. (in: a-proteobacteria) TaxID=1871050 RepID=UPI002606DAE0|nr:glycosyltransferase [Bosea sp. (in: a-proteobacteria)]MCO5090458.1 glycosyltransferase [Bosea sp. (in: a-proteobacteria)]